MYKILALVMLFVGGIGGLYRLSGIWETFGVGLMTIFNMTALIPMAPQAVQALKDYEKEKIVREEKKIDRCIFLLIVVGILLCFLLDQIKGEGI